MSGKRQHYLPQCLQAGFASHRTPRETYTWVYRKGAEPFNSNIINVGTEGYFYGAALDTDADDLITNAEADFGAALLELREGSAGNVRPGLLAALVAHLEIRTRHLRQNVLQVGDYLATSLLNQIIADSEFVDGLAQALPRSPEFREAMLRGMVENNIPTTMWDRVMDEVAARLPMLMPDIRATYIEFAKNLKQQLPSVLKNATKSGHISLLKKAIAPEARVQQYAQLHYAVLEVEHGRLILGDSAVVFKVQGPQAYKAFLDKDDALDAVFLPVTPSRILVGASDRLVVPADIQEQIARCSMEFFIASDRSEKHQELQLQIGKAAALLSQSELEEIVADLHLPG